MVRLENWSVSIIDNPLVPIPEKRVHGAVYGHSRFADGTRVTLSKVVSSNGRTIQTNNTTYILGDPDKIYVEYCKINNINIDYDNPIKVININDN